MLSVFERSSLSLNLCITNTTYLNIFLDLCSTNTVHLVFHYVLSTHTHICRACRRNRRSSRHVRNSYYKKDLRIPSVASTKLVILTYPAISEVPPRGNLLLLYLYRYFSRHQKLCFIIPTKCVTHKLGKNFLSSSCSPSIARHRLTTDISKNNFIDQTLKNICCSICSSCYPSPRL